MIVVHSESRNRNYRVHKLYKERVAITSGTMILFKGMLDTKDLTFITIYLYQQKWHYFSRRPIFLAILLNKQFLHLKHINLHPNTQLLSTQQHAYTSFLVTSWLYYVCITLACLNEFLRKPFT